MIVFLGPYANSFSEMMMQRHTVDPSIQRNIKEQGYY